MVQDMFIIVLVPSHCLLLCFLKDSESYFGTTLANSS